MRVYQANTLISSVNGENFVLSRSKLEVFDEYGTYYTDTFLLVLYERRHWRNGPEQCTEMDMVCLGNSVYH
jgi:hypothetical protein